MLRKWAATILVFCIFALAGSILANYPDADDWSVVALATTSMGFVSFLAFWKGPND